ncbi:hypothetical protein LINPERPRIM_LOCUS18265 [Linum perenne]
MGEKNSRIFREKISTIPNSSLEDCHSGGKMDGKVLVSGFQNWLALWQPIFNSEVYYCRV